MTEEVKQEGAGDTPAEETPESPETPKEDKGQKPETPKSDEGTADQSAELKKQIEEKDTLLKRQSKEIEQQRYWIGKLRKKAEEEGWELPEEAEGFSVEQVRQMVQESNAPLVEQINKLGITLSELARANKAQPSQGGGGGGQKPIEKKKAPATSPEDDAMLKLAGLVWDADKEAYVKKDKDGKIIRVYKPDKVEKTIR